jgi:hypothetical protein
VEFSSGTENRDAKCCIRAQHSHLCFTAEVNAGCGWLVVCMIAAGNPMSLGLGKWSALGESLPGRIFISHRRQETAWPAGRLCDVLVEHLPAEQVFRDIDNIDHGDEHASFRGGSGDVHARGHGGRCPGDGRGGAGILERDPRFDVVGNAPTTRVRVSSDRRERRLAAASTVAPVGPR